MQETENLIYKINKLIDAIDFITDFHGGDINVEVDVHNEMTATQLRKVIHDTIRYFESIKNIRTLEPLYKLTFWYDHIHHISYINVVWGEVLKLQEESEKIGLL